MEAERYEPRLGAENANRNQAMRYQPKQDFFRAVARNQQWNAVKWRGPVRESREEAQADADSHSYARVENVHDVPRSFPDECFNAN